MKAINIKTGKVVKAGSTVTSFRGEKAKLISLTRANEVGRDGKVVVEWKDRANGARHEYYAGVFDLKVEA